MDLGIIIAISGATFAIVGAMIGLFLWVRTESSSDRREFFQLVRSIEGSINEMKLENRDFHHRLLEIEKSRTH